MRAARFQNNAFFFIFVNVHSPPKSHEVFLQAHNALVALIEPHESLKKESAIDAVLTAAIHKRRRIDGAATVPIAIKDGIGFVFR